MNDEQEGELEHAASGVHGVPAQAPDEWHGSFIEISKLNNELVLAQRELALNNARLQRTLRDLTESREELVTQRDEIHRINQELARSNEALQQFAYIVSHDLQAPLRAIGGFAQLFRERYKSKLDDTADRWLGHILEGVEGMNRLVLDTLSFSRAGATLARRAVDLNLLLQKQRQQFAAQLQAVGGELTSDPLPTVNADPTQLEQVFQNLIQNALSYRSEYPPKIHASAARSGVAWVISIRDNGMGIAPQFHQAIFEPLRRIAVRAEVPGTGLGLAICARIVGGHGGTIWVESQLGAGSVFHVLLPDDPDRIPKPSVHPPCDCAEVKADG